MMASRLSQWLHALGLKFVYIDPALNYSGCYLADKWIPVYPNTDAALQLAIAHVWLTEGLYDKEYVESHAVGYEKFFDYVLGKVDGVSKTPAWASEKCGVPEWTIKAFARDWASKTVSITHGNGGPGIRGPFASEPGRLEPILLGMRGLGKPGVHQVKWIEWNLFTDKFPMPYQGKAIPALAHFGESVRPPKAEKAFPHYKLEEFQSVAEREKGRFKLSNFAQTIEELAEVCRTMEQAPQQSIPKCMVHDAILNGKVDWWGLYSFCGPVEEQWQQFHFPAEGCSKIHMIWTDSPCMVTCWNDGFRFVKALRSPEIECVVAQHPWLENDCYLADIILPVATKFEMDDIAEDCGGGIFVSVFREHAACPPVGESRNDFDCVAAVAKKISEMLNDGGKIYRAYTCNEKPVDRLIELFWQGSGVAHLDVNDDFHKKDIFVMPADPDIQKTPAGLHDFYMDPKSQPLSTPTGLLEFTSTAIEKHFPDDQERPPFPKWIEKSELHDERLGGERAKKYPLLCVSNHGRWRFHANLDDITWNREVETMKIRAKDGYQYEPFWLNPVESEKRGIKHVDIVKVFNERGTVLGAAYVTERLIPCACYMDHGARFDPIDAERLDRGGAINLISPTAITSKTCTGMVVSGFLVEVQKVTDEEMETWKARYPEAFGRKVDHACGVASTAGLSINKEGIEMSKVFAIDVAKCSGCYNCQLSCKDEHAGNDWTPYAKPQPDIGQFWLKVRDYVSGTIPKVRVHYIPRLCNHCANAPCIPACPAGAIYRREDGLVIINPEECVPGCRKCVEACPYEDVIYMNEETGIAQKCTGCAHLLDNGYKLPRCVEACPTDALLFGEEVELQDQIMGATVFQPESGAGPRVFYRNIPGQFIAGTVYDPVEKEVIIGARCRLNFGGRLYECRTDSYGDFWFKDLPVGKFDLRIEASGYATKTISDISTRECVNLGDLPLDRI